MLGQDHPDSLLSGMQLVWVLGPGEGDILLQEVVAGRSRCFGIHLSFILTLYHYYITIFQFLKYFILLIIILFYKIIFDVRIILLNIFNYLLLKFVFIY